MADYTQAKSTIIAHSLLTHPGMLEGTPVSVAGSLSATVTIRIASIETTANATGVMVWVQGSLDASGDAAWVNLATFRGSTTVPETEALSGGGEPQGETVIVVASTANFVVEDFIYVLDAGTLTDSEWHHVTAIDTNVSVSIDYGLAVAKDDADSLWTEADEFICHINDLGGLSRINVLVVHEAATGANLHVLAECLTATDIE